MTSTAGPIEGPCVAWISGADVASCCGLTNADSNQAAALDEAAVEASMLLFEMSGRKYTGGCTQTVRPCRPTCSCWGQLGVGAAIGTASWYWAPWQGVWSWQDGCGGRCGCGFLSQVLLSGYPVTSITEVVVDGVVIPEIDPVTSQPNWRLDDWRYLTRLGYIDSAGVAQVGRWPACQNLSLPETEPGTWAVTYDYGVAPPLAGLRAAEQLACELYRACQGGECALPQGVTRLQRQGVTIDRGLLLSWSQSVTSRGVRTGSWNTGLALVDAFLSAYNPWGMRRRPAFWSPDIPEFAQKLGT